MHKTTEIQVGGETMPFDLDFQTRHWSSSKNIPAECDFPLIAVVDGLRYELYSDKTFSEEEL